MMLLYLFTLIFIAVVSWMLYTTMQQTTVQTGCPEDQPCGQPKPQRKCRQCGQPKPQCHCHKPCPSC